VGRKNWCESVDEMQRDSDAYLYRFNNKRPHQARNMDGRTPSEAFKKGLISRLKKKDKPETKRAA